MARVRIGVVITAVTFFCVPAHAQDAVKACIASNESAINLRKAGKLIEARAASAGCAAEACPDAIKATCKKRVDELNAAIPGVAFDVKDATGNSLTQVKVTVDGAPLVDHLDGTAVAVDPGSHQFRFEVVGQPPVERTFLISEGDKAHRETIALAATPAATTQSPARSPTEGSPGAHAATESSQSQGALYVEAAVLGLNFYYVPQTPFGTSTNWAGYRPDIELGVHPSGRDDGFVIGLRQSFQLTAFRGLAGGASQLRLGYDISLDMKGHELSLDPYAVVGVGYVFDGVTGFGGPSAGISGSGGFEGKLFLVGPLYAFARVEVGVQCYHDVGLCELALDPAAGVGVAFLK